MNVLRKPLNAIGIRKLKCIEENMSYVVYGMEACFIYLSVDGHGPFLERHCDSK